jgi:hypothetical protein
VACDGARARTSWSRPPLSLNDEPCDEETERENKPDPPHEHLVEGG